MKTLISIILILIPAFIQAQSVSTFAGTVQGYENGNLQSNPLSVKFNTPIDVDSDSQGNLYIADYSNRVIRKISPNGEVTLFAGMPGQSGYLNGSSASAMFSSPRGIAVNKVTGDVYVADDRNYVIRKISNGEVTLFAGTPNISGFFDGIPGTGRFRGISNLRFDSLGTLYATDYVSNAIRKIDSTGTITTLVGGQLGNADGNFISAKFNKPTGLTFDRAWNLIISDENNRKIKKIDLIAQTVTTIAGNGQNSSVNGPALNASFSKPSGLACDSTGNIYICDESSNQIRILKTNGQVETYCGSGVAGSLNSTLLNSTFRVPIAISFLSNNKMLIADSDNHLIRSISLNTNTEELLESQVKVYPNPVTENLYLEFPSYLESNIHIYSMDGKLVRSQKISDIVYVGDFSSGLYSIVISNKHQAISFKFTKE